jgi:hypothetical protein
LNNKLMMIYNSTYIYNKLITTCNFINFDPLLDIIKACFPKVS